MLDTILQVTGSLALASVSLASAWFVYRSTRKRDKVTAELSKEANAITWSKDLLARVETLERRDGERTSEIRDLRNDLAKLGRVFGVAVNYIERFLQWAKDGSRPPIPDIPESLYEHLNPSLIDEHHRQQQEHNPKA